MQPDMQMFATPFDAVVIGGSYAGLSAAMQIARGRRNVAVIDAGKPRNRFATASHGFFGQDGAEPARMIESAREKLTAYPNVYFIADEAVGASGQEGAFVVTLASGPMLEASRLVLATGIADILPDMPGLAERWGVSVLHCPYCHGYEFGGAPLGVLATTPHCAEKAMIITEWGPTTLFLNGQPMPDGDILAKLAKRGVTVEPVAVDTLEGEAQTLRTVVLADGRRIAMTALYLTPRTVMASPLAESLGCAFEDGFFGPVIVTDGKKATSIPGVFAAGDAARGMHNATWASADGVTAGAAVHHSLIFEGLDAA
ncbi:NAD(P)/FAD-dependent oxidoreductase [Mesorhizobium retamae]|uniref:Thioredoxin reductase n=1 Tax=Mesorhizobium retamae TaxID=2912854 RepID=A0ABS9QKE2_9HYPH|nr:NAD(P)/FAD-dependent oxidoreductase [Mesorhizobium sp. IRAMC:0171]MCG7507298.1 NAD(P)/FAD-dependent oxidoreductase [Mesorhizobium sp. IRAMC:0171]